MNDFYLTTLFVQFLTVLFYSVILFHYAQKFHQIYLRYWSFSAFALCVVVLSSFTATILISEGVVFNSVYRLADVFFLNLASFLHVYFLYIGTNNLIFNKKPNLKWLLIPLVVIFALAIIITLFKANSQIAEDRKLRYLFRNGIRYLINGAAFFAVGIYIISQRKEKILGKSIVSVFAIIHGLQMLVLFYVIFDYAVNGNSQYLQFVVQTFGIFELMIYSMIVIGMVMWLLEIEGNRGKKVSKVIYQSNKTDSVTGVGGLDEFKQYLRSSKKRQQGDFTLAILGTDPESELTLRTHPQCDHFLSALSKRTILAFPDVHFFGQIRRISFVVVLEEYSKDSLNRIKEIRRFLSSPLKIGEDEISMNTFAGAVKLRKHDSIDESIFSGFYALQQALEADEPFVLNKVK